jgi:hypothetical protein
MTTNDPRWTEPFITPNCGGRGTNPACKLGRKQGKPVHITPPPFTPDDHRLVLNTYHYATETDARRAYELAVQHAPIVHTDADLYTYRAEGTSYKLVPDWIDPTMRR